MKLQNLTYIIRELNGALDTGKYDDIPMQAASQHIKAGDLVSWLKNSGSCPKSVISVRLAAAGGHSSDRWPR
jgi:hypothetical protein